MIEIKGAWAPQMPPGWHQKIAGLMAWIFGGAGDFFGETSHDASHDVMDLGAIDPPQLSPVTSLTLVICRG